MEPAVHPPIYLKSKHDFFLSFASSRRELDVWNALITAACLAFSSWSDLMRSLRCLKVELAGQKPTGQKLGCKLIRVATYLSRSSSAEKGIAEQSAKLNTNAKPAFMTSTGQLEVIFCFLWHVHAVTQWVDIFGGKFPIILYPVGGYFSMRRRRRRFAIFKKMGDTALTDADNCPTLNSSEQSKSTERKPKVVTLSSKKSLPAENTKSVNAYVCVSYMWVCLSCVLQLMSASNKRGKQSAITLGNGASMLPPPPKETQNAAKAPINTIVPPAKASFAKPVSVKKDLARLPRCVL